MPQQAFQLIQPVDCSKSFLIKYQLTIPKSKQSSRTLYILQLLLAFSIQFAFPYFSLSPNIQCSHLLYIFTRFLCAITCCFACCARCTGVIRNCRRCRSSLSIIFDLLLPFGHSLAGKFFNVLFAPISLIGDVITFYSLALRPSGHFFAYVPYTLSIALAICNVILTQSFNFCTFEKYCAYT